jgi:oxygen-independent coproporphyrinogen-3 oxidase
MQPGVTLSRLHLGGGTPTLLPAALSNELIGAIFAAFPLADEGEFSVEIDPNVIDDARLDALVASGLNRASIGVQDFDTDVQAAIGRIQSYETTAHVVDGLRARGIKELNLDVLYGLPHQTLHGIKATLDQIVALDPSRIALFGYAHVPWMSKRQALISEDTLPQGEDRLALFQTAAKHLQDAGYPQFGIDHFAKPDDPLAQAFSDGKLRRNFQGYTEDQSEVLLGLGASSISRFPQGYAQNQSATAIYAKAISLGRLSAARGHEFSEDDKLNAAIIEQLMCYYRVEVGGVAARTGAADATVRAVLQQIHESHPKMTQLDGDCLEIEAEARDWVRVIASAADQYTAAGRAHSFAV